MILRCEIEGEDYENRYEFLGEVDLITPLYFNGCRSIWGRYLETSNFSHNHMSSADFLRFQQKVYTGSTMSKWVFYINSGGEKYASQIFF